MRYVVKQQPGHSTQNRKKLPLLPSGPGGIHPSILAKGQTTDDCITFPRLEDKYFKFQSAQYCEKEKYDDKTLVRNYFSLNLTRTTIGKYFRHRL